MTSPNSEQLKAIEHTGGVLLSAGAGSGKTFVLIHHIIYLLKRKLAKNYSSSIDLRKELKSTFSKIVLMTYTKKAAGELVIRLKKALEELSYQSEEEKKSVLSAVDSMYVGTIHGFCYRLLSQGYFTDVPSDLAIASSIELNEKMRKIYWNWMEQYEGFKNQEKLRRLFFGFERELLNSLTTLFQDAELRQAQLNHGGDLPHLQILLPEIDKKIRTYLFSEELLNSDIDFSLEAAKTSGKWPIFLNKYREWSRDPNRFEVEKFSEFILFRKNMRLSPPKGANISSDLIEYFNEVKNYVKFYLDNFDDLISYDQELDSEDGPQSFFNAFLSLVQFMDERYLDSPGLNYSDLEYYLLKGLENEQRRERISRTYSYLIVDEFQDTSHIQFEIISKIVNFDYSRLFCVGDIKQAIYSFRGGDVSVFLKAKNLIPQFLSLRTNYRSAPNVITFNNLFFEFIFKAGEDYQPDTKKDLFKIPLEAQVIPNIERQNQGEIIATDIDLPKDDNGPDLDFVEAKAIHREILELAERIDPEESICVLYRKMTPSYYLLDRLLNSDAHLIAQVKVSYGEDPLISFFRVTLELLISFEKLSEETILKLISIHLQPFGFDMGEELLAKYFARFLIDYRELGLGVSFDTFLAKLGVLNSNHQNNKQNIDTLIKTFGGDVHRVWQNLQDINSGSKYSIELQVRKEGPSIIMMTVHASKGLEFDHLFLAGISTNGKLTPDRRNFGKTSGAFKWKREELGGDKYQTPQFIVEKELNTLLDFSESKRLLYVACTRAVKSLRVIRFYDDQKLLVTPKNRSWVIAFDEFSKRHDGVITFKKVSLDFQSDASLVKKRQLPLHFTDTLGMFTSHSEKLLLLSELSVTKLSLLADCPRKFYLKNILKISSSVNTWEGDGERHEEQEEEISEKEQASGLVRGERIHQLLSQFIKSSFKNIESSDKSELSLLNWVGDQLMNDFSSPILYSEVPIKFQLFGVMVYGIPDLVIQDSHTLEIWDFKTGSGEGFLDRYWAQLLFYAHAYLSEDRGKSRVHLKLVFVDLKKTKKKTYSRDEVLTEVLTLWSKVNAFDQVNDLHCQSCEFGNLCHPKT